MYSHQKCLCTWELEITIVPIVCDQHSIKIHTNNPIALYKNGIDSSKMAAELQSMLTSSCPATLALPCQLLPSACVLLPSIITPNY